MSEHDLDVLNRPRRGTETAHHEMRRDAVLGTWQRRRRVATASLVALLAAGFLLGILFVGQPRAVAIWGTAATWAVGALLLLIVFISAGLMFRETNPPGDRVGAPPSAQYIGEPVSAEPAVVAPDEGLLEQPATSLAAPLIRVTEKVVIIPLVGTVDHEHLQHIRTDLLRGIEQQRARVALIDLTAVTEITPESTEPFSQLILAIELMGCRVVLTGISRQLAQTLVERGVGLAVETHRDVMAGLTQALDQSVWRENRAPLPNPNPTSRPLSQEEST